jgi:hypothetical protein
MEEILEHAKDCDLIVWQVDADLTGDALRLKTINREFSTGMVELKPYLIFVNLGTPRLVAEEDLADRCDENANQTLGSAYGDRWLSVSLTPNDSTMSDVVAKAVDKIAVGAWQIHQLRMAPKSGLGKSTWNAVT